MAKAIVDTGVLKSLGLVNKIDLLELIFEDYFFPEAVWHELSSYDNPGFNKRILNSLKSHIFPISTKNHLSLIMDYGESEAVILFGEIKADFLLIDDFKARKIAESLGITCIGSKGIILKAKEKGLVEELSPIFKLWMESNRFFTKKLLNQILVKFEENPI
jgi:predicted nucleic acid-binding protein